MALRGNEMVEALIKVGKLLAERPSQPVLNLEQAYVEILANAACDGNKRVHLVFRR